MSKASLEFLKIPKYTVNDLKKQRLEDWRENGKHLKELFEQYDEEYRIKICSKCDDKQKKERKCYVFPAFDSNGNLKTRCNHMVKAQSNKFRKKIYSHIKLHLSFYNPST